jgi:HAMP domain-containing protein
MGSHRPADRDVPSSEWWSRLDPRESLVTRAALLFGGLVLMATFAMSWLGGMILHRAIEHEAGAKLETLSVQLGDKLDRLISERRASLQLLATLSAQQVADAPPAERRRLLDAALDSSGDFAWIGLADRRGLVVAATQGIFEGTEVGNRIWFRAATERPFAGNVHEIPELTKEMAGTESGPPRFLDLAVPVMHDGNLVGVIGAHLRWSAAHNMRLSVVPDSARREHVDATVYGFQGETLLDSGGSGWTEPPEAPDLGPRHFLRGVVTESASGVTYLTGYAWMRGVRDSRGTGWLVTVRQPAGDVFAAVPGLRRAILWSGFICALFVAGFSAIFAAQITRRFRAIGRAADRIRTGDVLTILPAPPGRSEFARMCASLRALVEDLRVGRERPGATAESAATPKRQGTLPPSAPL